MAGAWLREEQADLAAEKILAGVARFVAPAILSNEDSAPVCL